MKKILILLSIFLAVGFFYFWQNKDKEEKENTSIIPDIHKGIAGVNQLKEIRDENSASGPLFYTTDGEPIKISKTTELFDYDLNYFKSANLSCGQIYNPVYFENLISKFEGSNKIVYNFIYKGEELSSYKVVLIPNKMRYNDFRDFQRDFGFCDGNSEIYPKMFNNSWLLLVSYCKNSDCERVKNIIEPNLNFNY
jgi:hypothetical protein